MTRYMYNPRSGKWKTDQVVIKMQSEVHVHVHVCITIHVCIVFVHNPIL